MPGKTAGIERAFAPREIARLAGCFAGARGVDALLHDLTHHRGVLVEVLAQLVVDELRPSGPDVAVQLALGLAFELGLRQLHADHGGQALTHIVAGQVVLHVLEQTGLLAIEVDAAGQRAAEAAQMRAAVDGVDVVGEAEDALRVAIVVLERDLHRQNPAVRQIFLTLEIDWLFVQHRFAAVEVLDEFRDAAGIEELVRFDRILAFIGEGDLEAFVQECQFSQALRQRVVVELGGLHDGTIRLEGDACSGLATGFARLL